MSLGDTFHNTAMELGDGLEWYALTYADDGELDAETQRVIDDGRLIFALLHAVAAPLSLFNSELNPLIAAALAGDTKPLDDYCATIAQQEHVSPEWPGIARAAVTAIVALRQTFEPLRPQLQPIFDAYLSDHQKEQQQKHDDSQRDQDRRDRAAMAERFPKAHGKTGWLVAASNTAEHLRVDATKDGEWIGTLYNVETGAACYRVAANGRFYTMDGERTQYHTMHLMTEEIYAQRIAPSA